MQARFTVNGEFFTYLSLRKIAVAREIKRHEYRAGLTPARVKAYVHHGRPVVVETGAGEPIRRRHHEEIQMQRVRLHL